jgi:transposase
MKMERLEAKKINGKKYYYYSKWEWVNGKCRRTWQKYLGTLQKIAKAVDGGPAPLFAEIFEWGLPMALWKECQMAKIKEIINELCPKRNQGLTIGDYIVVAAINRAISPQSKRSIWEWFSGTSLLRLIPKASEKLLSSQRFWDHMDKIQIKSTPEIWKTIIKETIQREKIDLSSVSYDGTNFYTFIDTFNSRCDIARRGKNKQGRGNLRQVSYALFCSEDNHVPLYYDLYDGNRNDSKQFPLMLKRFNDFLKEVLKISITQHKTTLIFDKGNNSKDNFKLLDTMELDFVGSVKADEHKDLALLPNDSKDFIPCELENLKGAKAQCIKKEVYGKERMMVVVFNQNLFDSQWLTINNDIDKAMERLTELSQKLDDRRNGLIKKGKSPTIESIKKQCKSFLKRQYLKQIISFKVENKMEIPDLQFELEFQNLQELSNTYMGKNILITSHKEWDNDRIIRAYRSQFIIEDVFKEMKDRTTGSWWPLHHWTDSKINVHGLYCTITLLIRALMHRRVKNTGLCISMKRLLKELGKIREVVNIYPQKNRKKVEAKQSVLSKTSEVQDTLISALKLEKNVF